METGQQELTDEANVSEASIQGDTTSDGEAAGSTGQAGGKGKRKRNRQFRWDTNGGHDIPLVNAAIEEEPWDLARHGTVPKAWDGIRDRAIKKALPTCKRGSVLFILSWEGLKSPTAQKHVKDLVADYKKHRATSKKESGEEEDEETELDKLLEEYVQLVSSVPCFLETYTVILLGSTTHTSQGFWIEREGQGKEEAGGFGIL